MTEGTYLGDQGDIQEYDVGSGAVFILPEIINSDHRCPTLTLEAVDENGAAISELIASVQDMTVKPVNPLLNKDYTFYVKATSSGGGTVTTTVKSLRVGCTSTM